MPQGNPLAYLNASQFGPGGSLGQGLQPQSVQQLAGTLIPQLQQQALRQQPGERNEDRFVNQQQSEGGGFNNPFGNLGGSFDQGSAINLASAFLPGGSLIGPAINTGLDYRQSQLSGPSDFGFGDVMEAFIANSLIGDTFGAETLGEVNARKHGVVRSTPRQKKASRERSRQDKDEDRGGFKSDRASRGSDRAGAQPGGF